MHCVEMNCRRKLRIQEWRRKKRKSRKIESGRMMTTLPNSFLRLSRFFSAPMTTPCPYGSGIDFNV